MVAIFTNAKVMVFSPMKREKTNFIAGQLVAQFRRKIKPEFDG
jgi:hypothetical protein